MPRDGDKIRRKLQQVALELYSGRGYDQTTAAEIAAKAGVTERTFFRHFKDKRDVFFGGETVLRDLLVAAVRDAPAELGPWDALFRAFSAAEHLFVENRPFAEPRHRLIESNPALQERALAKTRSLIAGLTEALLGRGVPDQIAFLAAQMGMAALGHATSCWFHDDTRELSDYIVQAFEEVRDLSASGVAVGGRAKTPRKAKP